MIFFFVTNCHASTVKRWGFIHFPLLTKFALRMLQSVNIFSTKISQKQRRINNSRKHNIDSADWITIYEKLNFFLVWTFDFFMKFYRKKSEENVRRWHFNYFQINVHLLEDEKIKSDTKSDSFDFRSGGCSRVFSVKDKEEKK